MQSSNLSMMYDIPYGYTDAHLKKKKEQSRMGKGERCLVAHKVLDIAIDVASAMYAVDSVHGGISLELEACQREFGFAHISVAFVSHMGIR